MYNAPACVHPFACRVRFLCALERGCVVVYSLSGTKPKVRERPPDKQPDSFPPVVVDPSSPGAKCACMLARCVRRVSPKLWAARKLIALHDDDDVVVDNDNDDDVCYAESNAFASMCRSLYVSGFFWIKFM